MGAISKIDLYVIILLMSFNYVMADFDDELRYYQEDDNRRKRNIFEVIFDMTNSFWYYFSIFFRI